jgi:Cys-rich repeat protein
MIPDVLPRRFAHAALLSAAMLAVLAGCSEEPSSPAGGVTFCQNSAQCPARYACVSGICLPGSDGACDSDSACAGSLVCDPGTSTCVPPQCAADVDCALGELCDAGLCAVNTEADRDRDGVPDGSAQQPIDNCPDTPQPAPGRRRRRRARRRLR